MGQASIGRECRVATLLIGNFQQIAYVNQMRPLVRYSWNAKASSRHCLGFCGNCILLISTAFTYSCHQDSGKPELQAQRSKAAEVAANLIKEPRTLNADSGESGGRGRRVGELVPDSQEVALSGELRGVRAEFAEEWGKGAEGQRRPIYPEQRELGIYDKADSSSQRIGYLRNGEEAYITGESQAGKGCKGQWYPTFPRGFVCSSHGVNLDKPGPIYDLNREGRARIDRPLPYLYGTVRRPGPAYGRLPNNKEVLSQEPGHEKRYKEWLKLSDENGQSYTETVWPSAELQSAESQSAETIYHSAYSSALELRQPFLKELPRTDRKEQQEGLRRLNLQSRVGFSILQLQYQEGRRYAISTHLEVLPVDRLRPIRGSAIHGFEIADPLKELPFAIVRKHDVKATDGSSQEYGARIPLSGKKKKIGSAMHYESQDGKWLSERSVAMVRTLVKPPKWAKDGERWIDVNLSKQLLTLYDGTSPVYATIVSTGEAGLADHQGTTATKQGSFRIHSKHFTATMSSDAVGEEFELRDVPYVQYFDTQGYALHAAYWHDSFGSPRSHGCINLAPEDARRIFFFTEPALPPTWHGITGSKSGTLIFIHR